jgi:hypothetical protein
MPAAHRPTRKEPGVRIRIVVASVATVLGSLAIPAAADAADDGGVSPRVIGGSTVSSAPWAAAVFSNGSFT